MYKPPIIMIFSTDIKKINNSNFIDFKASEFGLFMVSFILYYNYYKKDFKYR